MMFKAGASQTCITPPPGLELAGFVMRDQPALGVLDDLYARALFISNGNESLLWINCDLFGFAVDWAAALKARLAGDLHDDLGQCLTALRLAVEAGPPGPAAERIAALFRGVHEALDRLLNALRPRLLERHGLDVALGRMVEDASTRFGLPIRLDLDADVDAIGDERAVAIFRVVQEALTNVGRHARAQHASVRLAEGPDGITLEVRDDGVGFDPEAAFHTGRLGLLGIRERARALDGQCRLESTPGRGTRLVVTLPPETAAASTQ